MNIATVWAVSITLLLVGCGWSVGPEAPPLEAAPIENMKIISSTVYPQGYEIPVNEVCYGGTVYLLYSKGIAPKFVGGYTVSC